MNCKIVSFRSDFVQETCKASFLKDYFSDVARMFLNVPNKGQHGNKGGPCYKMS